MPFSTLRLNRPGWNFSPPSSAAANRSSVGHQTEYLGGLPVTYRHRSICPSAGVEANEGYQIWLDGMIRPADSAINFIFFFPKSTFGLPADFAGRNHIDIGQGGFEIGAKETSSSLLNSGGAIVEMQ